MLLFTDKQYFKAEIQAFSHFLKCFGLIGLKPKEVHATFVDLFEFTISIFTQRWEHSYHYTFVAPKLNLLVSALAAIGSYVSICLPLPSCPITECPALGDPIHKIQSLLWMGSRSKGLTELLLCEKAVSILSELQDCSDRFTPGVQQKSQVQIKELCPWGDMPLAGLKPADFRKWQNSWNLALNDIV